jgi:SM-20-related protein
MSLWPDLFVVQQFFDQLECETLLAELKAASGSGAVVYGQGTPGAIDERVRKTFRVQPARQTVELVRQRLLACKEAIENHFAVTLTECEEPQFLRYREGDFFVAHQDGNTGLLRLDTERRLISTIIFLSEELEAPGPGVHCGGSLVFSNLRNSFRLQSAPGMLVAFRSETTHEVTPVTHGERYSIASWYR